MLWLQRLASNASAAASTTADDEDENDDINEFHWPSYRPHFTCFLTQPSIGVSDYNWDLQAHGRLLGTGLWKIGGRTPPKATAMWPSEVAKRLTKHLYQQRDVLKI